MSAMRFGTDGWVGFDGEIGDVQAQARGERLVGRHRGRGGVLLHGQRGDVACHHRLGAVGVVVASSKRLDPGIRTTSSPTRSGCGDQNSLGAVLEGARALPGAARGAHSRVAMTAVRASNRWRLVATATARL